jgi:hypothetical protein
MADTVIRLVEGFRDDYRPGVRTWDAFALLLIISEDVRKYIRPGAK